MYANTSVVACFPRYTVRCSFPVIVSISETLKVTVSKASLIPEALTIYMNLTDTNMSSLYLFDLLRSVVSSNSGPKYATFSVVLFPIFLLVVSSIIVPVLSHQDDIGRRLHDEEIAEEWLSTVAERAVEPQVREQIAKNKLKQL